MRAVPFDSLLAAASPPSDPTLRDVYDARGIAFIHIPKCAGTTVETLLYGYSVKHRTWADLRAMAPDRFDAWLKIAVVRDPVDRFLSAFDYLSHGGRNLRDQEFSRRFVVGHEVNRFIGRLDDVRFRHRTLRWFHFRPQSDFVTDSATGRIMVDRLMPLERLGEDLSGIMGCANGVPILNATAGPRTRRDALTPASIARINSIYEADGLLHASALTGHAVTSRAAAGLELCNLLDGEP